MTQKETTDKLIRNLKMIISESEVIRQIREKLNAGKAYHKAVYALADERGCL